jgi:alpha-glucoside transport system substrate-binding protein
MFFLSRWFLPQLKAPISGVKKLSVGLSLGAIALTSCSQPEASTEATTSPAGARTVTVLGAFVGEQQLQLEEALAPFEQETGIDVIYEGTDAFTTLLPVRIDSGDSPDIAMFPQPGLMRSLAEEGALVPVTEVLSREQLQQYYPDSWIDLSTVNDQIYGIWYRAALKSLVWYSPKQFEAAGYEIPQTWDEMIALSDQIVADGKTPWCLGMEGGNSSGWPGTDWIEDIVLQAEGPDFYDQWVQHEVPFNAPQVKNAFDYFGRIIRTPGYVYGGKTGALSTPWGDSVVGLFTEEPECYLQRQGNFVSTFFPEGAVLGEDIDFFPTPTINSQYEGALLVGGDIFAMLQDTPEARELMAYLATPVPHESWAAQGNFLSANKQVDLNVYADPISRKQAELLTTAEIIQFDGSDSMPGAVGTGTFWSGMMDFVAGASATDVTDKIEYYWPEETAVEDLAADP